MSSDSDDSYNDHDVLLNVCLVSGPVIAWLYAVIVWGLYAVTHECRWSDKLDSLAIRTALLVASLASSSVHNNAPIHILPMSTLVVMISFFWLSTAYLLQQTRRQDVVGFVQQPYFGKHHLKGQTVVITGANQGIGKETTLQLAAMGATKIYMLCRSQARAEAARQEILQRSNPEISPDQLEIIPMDLGDYASIHKAVDTLGQKLLGAKISVLINNAGLMMGTQAISKDGHDLMMQANHLGHFLLTRLLIDKNMLTPKNARILNVASSTHYLCTGGMDYDDLMCLNGKRQYTLFGQYSMSKLANVLFTKELCRRHDSQLLAYAINPGIVRTNVTSNMQWYWRVPNYIFGYFVERLQKAPPEGAYSQVYMATAAVDTLPPNGCYIADGKEYPSSKASHSLEDAKRLWQVSEELVGLVASESKAQ